MISIYIRDPGQAARVLRYFAMILSMAASKPNHSMVIGIAIDPRDSGVKFQVDYGVWSPPMTGDIEDET